MSKYILVPAISIEKTEYQYFLRDRENGNPYELPVSCDVFEPKTMADFHYSTHEHLYFKSKEDAKKFVEDYNLDEFYEIVDSYFNSDRLILITK